MADLISARTSRWATNDSRWHKNRQGNNNKGMIKSFQRMAPMGPRWDTYDAKSVSSISRHTLHSNLSNPKNDREPSTEEESQRRKRQRRSSSASENEVDKEMLNGTLPAPFTPPDPFDIDTPPAERDMNPHFQLAGRGEVPTLPPTLNAQYTRASFPRVVIPYEQLVHNLAEEQVEQINKDPANHLAIVPFGAGKWYYDQNPTCNREIVAFLKSLGFEGNDEIQLAKPIPRNESSKRRRFEGPWPMILKHASEEMRSFLLWQQTFAISPIIAFNAIAFDTTVQSWVIMNITGDAVEDTKRARQQVMGTVKKRFWEEMNVRSEISRHIAAAGNASLSVGAQVDKITSTLELTFIDALDAQGRPNPIFQLTGKPATTNIRDHKILLSCMRAPGQASVHVTNKGKAKPVSLKKAQPFVTPDGHKLIVNRTFVGCIWCKADTHPAHKCPFPAIEDWLGPKNNAKVEKEEEWGAETAGAGGSGLSRGGRGRGKPPHHRGSNRDGSSSGGWTKVPVSKRRG